MTRYFYLVVQTGCWSLLMIGFASCREQEDEGSRLFRSIPSSYSSIDFENRLTDTDDFNIIEYLYFYNGGGVAIGDINNDGLPDIYFSSNQNHNKLYLNKGDFVFEDITAKAGVQPEGNWKTGVVMADVNGDGLLDIFVCGVGNYKKFNGRNQLYMNNGDLTFTEQTKAYGLDFQGFSTHAAFFDYDLDGDLDLYLLNHSVHTARSYGDVLLRFQSDPLAGDRLYRNELVPDGTPFFRDVTSRAGILSSQIGYGLGVGVSDFNQDGFPDLYISNDFHENDYLYLNQKDGTFKQVLERSLTHTSRFSMGNDIADINNDGWQDIITLDMMPRDEKVIKTTAGEDTYEIFEFKLQYGYHYQFARNTLQLHRGVDQDGVPSFSDIAPMSGVEATDWSWAPLLADFDNDGFKDLFVANGIEGRPNGLDYISYISSDSAQRFFSDEQLISKLPSGKVTNYFFRNKGDLNFEDVSKAWIGNNPSLSNGAAYADLDRDGDLDLVVNNINEQAYLLRNENKSAHANFIQVKLKGAGGNRFGVGAKMTVYAGIDIFYGEQFPSRGWMSSVDYLLHMGLGSHSKIDSLVIQWPLGKGQKLYDQAVNQILEFDENEAGSFTPPAKHDAPLLREGTNLPFVHKENRFIAFSLERLMPRMISTEGPKTSTGDVNGDKLQDFFVGGAAGQTGALFLQTSKGNFNKSIPRAFLADSLAEDTGSALFDADGNGTLDLLVAGGGQQYEGEHATLQPRLYMNDGKGNFTKRTENLPRFFVNASCVKPADVDLDGDLDVFVGGRVIAGQYGMDAASYILINDGKGKFTDETSRYLSTISNGDGKLGMVTDASWIDLNKDAKPDLMVVGEWMPVTILVQENGKFTDRTTEYGLANTYGWWNTLLAADADLDGDMDFFAGNAGLNSRLHPKPYEPVRIFIGDIDGNGSFDPVMTYFNQGREYPFISRDQLVKQVPSLKRKFSKYEDYEEVRLSDILTSGQQEQFVKKQAFTFASMYIENTGNNGFALHELPPAAQMFPIFSFLSEDLNDDKKPDLLAVGNLHAVQPDLSRFDGGLGLVLFNNGKGNFESDLLNKSGFRMKGEGRDIQSLVTSTGERLILVARNNDTLLVFQKKKL